MGRSSVPAELVPLFYETPLGIESTRRDMERALVQSIVDNLQ